MDNKLLIESLAMDLKRVSLGYHRGSSIMAKRFSEEALKRREEIDISKVKPYIGKILESLPESLNQADKTALAENVQVYSTLLQNYCVKSL